MKWCYIKARVHFLRSVPSSAQLSKYTRRGWVLTDKLDTCAVPPTWLALSQHAPRACAVVRGPCARSQIMITRTGWVGVREPSWWWEGRNAVVREWLKYTLALRHLRKRKTANRLKEYANSLYDSRWRLWPRFSVPLVTAVNKAALLRLWTQR